jgi:hypothetical protein
MEAAPEEDEPNEAADSAASGRSEKIYMAIQKVFTYIFFSLLLTTITNKISA